MSGSTSGLSVDTFDTLADRSAEVNSDVRSRWSFAVGASSGRAHRHVLGRHDISVTEHWIDPSGDDRYLRRVRTVRSVLDMTQEQVEDILALEVSSILGLDVDKAPLDEPLDALGMDSMAFVELLVAIEQRFAVKLMRTDMRREDLRSIRALATRICRAA
ncbi:MAG: acyl carrier protein [Deltaproteobacteria bacterium]|nr:acyl carrier protein [Deltaproteobacteria bacterium]